MYYTCTWTTCTSLLCITITQCVMYVHVIVYVPYIFAVYNCIHVHVCTCIYMCMYIIVYIWHVHMYIILYTRCTCTCTVGGTCWHGTGSGLLLQSQRGLFCSPQTSPQALFYCSKWAPPPSAPCTDFHFALFSSAPCTAALYIHVQWYYIHLHVCIVVIIL